MITVVLFLFILSCLVLIHEFGHFIIARRAGMKVYEFGWGFPPRAFGVYRDPVTKKFVWVFGKNKKETRNQKQETDLLNTVGGSEKPEEFPTTLYSVNWLPLGGFVKIKGENGEEASQPDSFGYYRTGRKLMVLLAGVIMNFLFAAVILGAGFMIGLPADVTGLEDKQAIIVQEPAVMVQQVEADSPAARVGLRFGDKIIRINDTVITNSGQMAQYVREHTGQELKVVTVRNNEELNFTVTPAELKINETPRLGVVLADAGLIRYPWYVAMYKGFVAAAFGLVNIFAAFYFLIKNLIMGNGLALAVSGPVGIAVVIGESARLGLNYLINVTAMISLSLAVINVLPIPALDGGRALFVAIEGIFGKKVPMKYEQIAHTIGFVLLMLLIVVVTWRDIARLL